MSSFPLLGYEPARQTPGISLHGPIPSLHRLCHVGTSRSASLHIPRLSTRTDLPPCTQPGLPPARNRKKDTKRRALPLHTKPPVTVQTLAQEKRGSDVETLNSVKAMQDQMSKLDATMASNQKTLLEMVMTTHRSIEAGRDDAATTGRGSPAPIQQGVASYELGGQTR
jgi:hypothetical protein